MSYDIAFIPLSSPSFFLLLLAPYPFPDMAPFYAHPIFLSPLLVSLSLWGVEALRLQIYEHHHICGVATRLRSSSSFGL